VEPQHDLLRDDQEDAEERRQPRVPLLVLDVEVDGVGHQPAAVLTSASANPTSRLAAYTSPSPSLARSSAARASSSRRLASDASIDSASTASPTSTSAWFLRTCTKPSSVAYRRTVPSASVTRVSPGWSSEISGAWLARMPSSPAAPGTTTRSASPEKTMPSGVISSTGYGVNSGTARRSP